MILSTSVEGTDEPCGTKTASCGSFWARNCPVVEGSEYLWKKLRYSDDVWMDLWLGGANSCGSTFWILPTGLDYHEELVMDPLPHMTDPSTQEMPRLASYSLVAPSVHPSRVFKKAVQAVHCHPAGNGELTATARKCFNALVIVAQDTFAAMSDEHRAQVRDLRAAPIFSIQIGQLCTLIDYKSRDTSWVYDALSNLFQWEFVFNVMGDEDGETKVVKKIISRFIHTLHLQPDERPGEIGFEVPHEVLMMMLSPFPFAQIDMRIVNALGGSHAIALYENCVRYLNTNNKVTAMLPVDEWVSLISGVGNYPNAYRDFKRYVLLPAMKILAELDSVPFKLELLERRGPRAKVIELQFKLTLKSQPGLDLEHPPLAWQPRTIDLLTSVIGFKKNEIALLAHAATEAEVNEAMMRFSSQATKPGKVIEDRRKYFRGILANVQTGRPKDAEPKQDEHEQMTHLPPLRERSESVRKAFEVARLAATSKYLSTLPPEGLEGLHALFEEGATPVDKTFLAKGWGSPILNKVFASWCLRQASLSEAILTAPELQSLEAWAVANENPVGK